MFKRIVWWNGQQRHFHPNKIDLRRGYVYLNGRRVYGTVEFSGLGWVFRDGSSHDLTRSNYAHTQSVGV